MRILLTGSTGRLGGVLARDLAGAEHRVFPVTRADVDLRRPEDLGRVVQKLAPDVIVNCAAYNAVDAAEDNSETAFAVNARAPAALAEAADRLGALVVHYSTDFVFDGEASEPYAEDAPTNPLNVYGASKLAGEHSIRSTRRHYILRVESLFGGSARAQRATVDYLADRLSTGLPVQALVDRIVSPTYVEDAAWATRALIERQAPFGTYHCVASGAVSWYELAQDIARRLGATAPVLAVRTDDFKTVAPRPRFCALSNRRLLALGIHLRTWRSALAHHLSARSDLARPLPRLRAGVL